MHACWVRTYRWALTLLITITSPWNIIIPISRRIMPNLHRINLACLIIFKGQFVWLLRKLSNEIIINFLLLLCYSVNKIGRRRVKRLALDLIQSMRYEVYLGLLVIIVYFSGTQLPLIRMVPRSNFWTKSWLWLERINLICCWYNIGVCSGSILNGLLTRRLLILIHFPINLHINLSRLILFLITFKPLMINWLTTR